MDSLVGPAVTKIFLPVKSFSQAISCKIYSKSCSGSGIFPAPTSPQARYPFAGSMTFIPYFRQISRLSCVTGFSYIRVFIAGAINFGAWHARNVVVSISSASPWATLAIPLAVAGAKRNTSARFANSTCSTWNWKFRSNVSTRHLFPVSDSKAIGVMKLPAFSVIITSTLACSFFNILAKLGIL